MVYGSSLLEQNQVEFISLKNMHISTSIGKAMLQMMRLISELERNLLTERVKVELSSMLLMRYHNRMSKSTRTKIKYGHAYV